MTDELSEPPNKLDEFVALTDEKGIKYTEKPIRDGIIRFKVRAGHDAHISLSATPSMKADPLIEVIIDGYGDNGDPEKYKNCIQKYTDHSVTLRKDSPGILSANEFSGFWIKWTGNDKRIRVGRDGYKPFLDWKYPEKFPLVAYVGVCTHSGATGTWKVEDGWEFTTPNDYDYTFIPLCSGFLKFEYKGGPPCYLRLYQEPTSSDNWYTISFGDCNNTKSAIQYRDDDSYMVISETPNIIKPKESTKFHIKWCCGKIQVLATDGSIIMQWTSPVVKPPLTRYKFWSSPGNDYSIARDVVWLGSCYEDYKPATPLQVLAACPFMWVDAKNGVVPKNAISGGLSHGRPVYVVRAKLEPKVLCVGTLEPPSNFALFAWKNKIWTQSKYEVLVAGKKWSERKDLWFPISKEKNMIKKALIAGITDESEELYVGRVHLNHGGVIIGSVSSTKSRCYYVDLDALSYSDNFDILLA